METKRHPECDGNQRKLCSLRCDLCFERSFASSELVCLWSKTNTKTPREVFKHSDSMYIFVCQKKECGHLFKASVDKISSGRCCPYCTNGKRKICKDEKCNLCWKTSFASSHRAKYWSKKNKGVPRDYTKFSHKKFIFDCPTCSHEFPIALDKINSNRWCPYCAVSSGKLCGDKHCDFCFNRSFAAINSELLEYWSEKNSKEPRELLPCSDNKYIFNCPSHGEFLMSLCNVTYGHWCSLCKRKTEAKLMKWLQKNYPGEVNRETRFDWCRGKMRYLPFDFCLENRKIIIELDGAQHFRQILNWTSPSQIQNRDRYKERKANQNGYSVVRLLQEDVWNDRNQWETLLKETLNRIREFPNITLIENGEETIVAYSPLFIFNS